jgi:glycosyltransferase involved in cell wall biosynthesis
LKKDKMNFKVSIIGDGPEKDKLKKLVKKYKLNDCVEFLGIKEHQDVIKIMSEYEIFMFTSSAQEGWGAVLNEAMACGCAVVASSVAGSTPFLINHNNNGKIYRYGNDKNAYRAVKELLLNKEEAEMLGKNAMKTIADEYNGEIAVERFIEAVDEFYKTGTITPQESGIFSQADVIKNNWYNHNA